MNEINYIDQIKRNLTLREYIIENDGLYIANSSNQHVLKNSKEFENLEQQHYYSLLDQMRSFNIRPDALNIWNRNQVLSIDDLNMN